MNEQLQKSFAIVVVCYNRTKGLVQLLNSLNRVDYCGRKDITLIFSIDNSGNSNVEDLAEAFEWEYGKKIIRTFSSRQGLKKHILQCGDYTTNYDIIVVLEDDIIVSNCFYSYAYSAAVNYWDDDNIAGISLYSFQKNWLHWIYRFEPMKEEYDTYFIKLAQSWGQVWTKKTWEAFKKWYCENKTYKTEGMPAYMNSWPESSWLKFYNRYCIEKNLYFVYPFYGVSSNTSEVGEHSNLTSNDYQVEMQYNKFIYNFQPFNSSAVIYDEYLNREGLESYIDANLSDITVDMYGTRGRNVKTKYIMTALENKKLSYLKSYKLGIRPIEMSVIYNLEGKGIYIYETTEYLDHIKLNNNTELLKYELRTQDWRTLIPFSIKLLFGKIISKFLNKIRK